MTDPIDTDELRPCPFCGHAATHYRETNWITCENFDGCPVHPCLDKRGRDMTAAQAIAAWNLRADLSALRAREAETRAENERLRRNNDMWRGQCERQAVSLTEMRAALRGLLSDCDLPADRPEIIAARAALSQPDSGEA